MITINDITNYVNQTLIDEADTDYFDSNLTKDQIKAIVFRLENHFEISLSAYYKKWKNSQQIINDISNLLKIK
jgi:hypothetical protein